jgi:hypothetical protein
LLRECDLSHNWAVKSAAQTVESSDTGGHERVKEFSVGCMGRSFLSPQERVDGEIQKARVGGPLFRDLFHY